MSFSGSSRNSASLEVQDQSPFYFPLLFLDDDAKVRHGEIVAKLTLQSGVWRFFEPPSISEKSDLFCSLIVVSSATVGCEVVIESCVRFVFFSCT